MTGSGGWAEEQPLEIQLDPTARIVRLSYTVVREAADSDSSSGEGLTGSALSVVGELPVSPMEKSTPGSQAPNGPPADKVGSITWLHLSDLHLGGPEAGSRARDVLDTLETDLLRMSAENDLRPDLIFFTGDAVYGESARSVGSVTDQFDQAQVFFDRIRRVFTPELPNENLFLVPGNHDITRATALADEPLTDWLKERSRTRLQVDDMVRHTDRQWRRFMERLEEYRQFLVRHGYNHLLEDANRLTYVAKREVNGVTIGVAGFNSAWSCRGDDRRGQVWIGGVWQVAELKRRLKQVDVSVALMHHPRSWLAEDDEPILRRRIEDFQFSLHGHEPQGWVDIQQGGHTRIGAGSCYDRSDKESGYNLVRLNLQAGTGEVWLRRYDRLGGGWTPRTIARSTNDLGVWPLSAVSLGSSRPSSFI